MVLEHKYPLLVRQQFDDDIFFHLSACDPTTSKGSTWRVWAKPISTATSIWSPETGATYTCGNRAGK
jgi:hypothetical protein